MCLSGKPLTHSVVVCFCRLPLFPALVDGGCAEADGGLGLGLIMVTLTLTTLHCRHAAQIWVTAC